jgi:GTPase involved in cell partitioning and DNA repair
MLQQQCAARILAGRGGERQTALRSFAALHGKRDGFHVSSSSDLAAILGFGKLRYDVTLPRKPAIIAANKMDAGRVAMEQLKELKAHSNIPIIPVCASDGRGVTNITRGLRELVHVLRDRAERAVPTPDFQSEIFAGQYRRSK